MIEEMSYDAWLEAHQVHALSVIERRKWLSTFAWARHATISCNDTILHTIERELFWTLRKPSMIGSENNVNILKTSEITVNDKHGFLNRFYPYQWILIDSFDGLPDLDILLRNEELKGEFLLPFTTLTAEHEAHFLTKEMFWSFGLIMSQEYLFQRLFRANRDVFLTVSTVATVVTDGRYCTLENKELWFDLLRNRACAGYSDALSVLMKCDAAYAKKLLKENWDRLLTYHDALQEHVVYPYCDLMTTKQLAMLWAQQKLKHNRTLSAYQVTLPIHKDYLQKINTLNALGIIATPDKNENLQSYIQKVMSVLKRYKTYTVSQEENLYL